jgi:hypothetical protein
MELVISISSLILSLIIGLLTLGFVYRQIRDATKATKVGLAVSLIDQLYSDSLVQEMLELILTDNVFFRHGNPSALITSIKDSEERDVYLSMNILLNRFQVLGLSYDIGVFDKNDLRGLRFEIIKIGRNEAIRSYFEFLNDDYQRSSGVEHDHFDALKKMYLAFEYDSEATKKFKEQCLFERRFERIAAMQELLDN